MDQHHGEAKYVRAYKNQIVLAVLREMFEDVKLNADAGTISGWRLILSLPATVFSDDGSLAIYGCPFRRSDVLTQVTHTGKTTTVTTCLKVRGWSIFPKFWPLLLVGKEFLANETGRMVQRIKNGTD
ncbi:MAG: hypothetical protein ACLSA6_12990 [Holdemania massiliensis]